MNHTVPHLGPMLADILAHPDDDTLRLIYADAIGEAGDEARAEFIRCQVEFHRRAIAGDGGISRFEIEASRLLRAHHAEWLPFLEPFRWQVETARCVSVCGPANGGRIVFLRGFVAEVHCSHDEWLEHGQAIARHPVKTVKLMDKKPYRYSPLCHEWYPSSTPHDPFELSEDLLDVMYNTDYPWMYRCSDFVGFTSEEYAYTALSRTCIEWARRQEQAP